MKMKLLISLFLAAISSAIASPIAEGLLDSIVDSIMVHVCKEAFQLMDQDKDGIIGKNDLRATFDALGKLAKNKELEEMLGEASGPINFTQLLTLFAKRMAGSGATDDDDVAIDDKRFL